MANQLKMAKVHSILTLRSGGWSLRRIARELGVHRETVARYVRWAERAPCGEAICSTMAQAGEAPDDPARDAPCGCGPPKPANAPLGSPVTGMGQAPAVSIGRPSCCEPLRELFRAKLEQGLSAKRIYQDLRAEHGFDGSYYSVRRFVRRLGSGTPLPFRRMECEAGKEAQVDFGRGAPILMPDGRRKRPHVLRVILSHSRKGYSEAVDRQTTEEFIRCLENAFQHFGGVPRTLVIDNLKAAVARADWFEPELNPKILAFCEHYGTVVLPTKPYTPRHKGKVERGVGYVQDNALRGRTFDSLTQENRFLTEWEATVADTRIHGTTRRQVGKLFTEVEQPALLPLPPERFPFFHEAQRIVNRDGHVEVAKAYYSAPPEFVGRTVWARWDGRVVRLFDQRLGQIAMHAQLEPGRFGTDTRHIAAEKRGGIERGTAWWLRKAHSIGAETGRWAEAVLTQRGIHAIRAIMGLVSLTQRHRDAEVEHACRIAHSHAAWRLRDIRNLLKRSAPPQEQFEFIDQHPLIRSLSDYGRLVRNAFEEVHA